jgi:hypothetical protein
VLLVLNNAEHVVLPIPPGPCTNTAAGPPGASKAVSGAFLGPADQASSRRNRRPVGDRTSRPRAAIGLTRHDHILRRGPVPLARPTRHSTVVATPAIWGLAGRKGPRSR